MAEEGQMKRKQSRGGPPEGDGSPLPGRMAETQSFTSLATRKP